MSPANRRLLGAIGGGLVAGLGITALLVAGERKSGKASELAALEREGRVKLGYRRVPDSELPNTREQAWVQGGHLALSVLAAAAYAAATDEDSDVLASGAAFGLAFYALAHWLTGPALGVKQPEWRSAPGEIGMHTANHLLFGLATAAGAKLAQKGLIAQ